MFRSMKWIAPVAGLALFLGFNQVTKAADEAPAAGKATVTVTVQDKDGKGVEGVRVRLVSATPPKTEGGAEAKAAGDGGKKGGGKMASVAQGTTDASGKAVLANVPDGEYTVMASLKGGGAGRETVKVEGGKDVAVTVTLKDKKPKAEAPPAEAK
ncbi:MAG TPA: carboxypeptidase-like regulatory domain-containing protein [Tepidisphaeraceae bacterium]|nr:carboxypeptidase-like regulatory domain-containing protein [Tepidisphaeraceae bacterium]